MTMIIRNNKVYAGSGGGSGNANIVKVTQAEYDALPESKNSDGVLYAITDGESQSAGEDADMVIYTEEDGSKTTVQDKLSELNQSLNDQNKNKVSGFGEVITFTLPYTVPKDGIIYVLLAPKSTDYANYTIEGLCGNQLIAKVPTHAGASVSHSYPVKTGDVLVLQASENVNGVDLRFVPFE